MLCLFHIRLNVIGLPKGQAGDTNVYCTGNALKTLWIAPKKCDIKRWEYDLTDNVEYKVKVVSH